ncbi:hypothetical protein TNCT_268011 [Trichonephila clavata]|uniref:Uncharacterized protein n=1 Tax=Trichonephila clavata TaxID=2740835 RepID=A0A8X6JQ36_TRICU|nr:hypothetical protein TNCT_268011 [Trichonephila clavata]
MPHEARAGIPFVNAEVEVGQLAAVKHILECVRVGANITCCMSMLIVQVPLEGMREEAFSSFNFTAFSAFLRCNSFLAINFSFSSPTVVFILFLRRSHDEQVSVRGRWNASLGQDFLKTLR